jgi:hypothetical protein
LWIVSAEHLPEKHGLNIILVWNKYIQGAPSISA